jgi:ectoine hydroxylase-related dioxygenase (phytanoyl-CoA dioxygenase family)
MNPLPGHDFTEDRARFFQDGFLVIERLLTDRQIALARQLVSGLVARYQAGDPAVRAEGISVAEALARRPQALPAVTLPETAPFLIGDLMALEPRFAAIFGTERIWLCAAALLGCPPAQLVFHFSNITRKPAGYGPAVGWHRDADNSYFASADAVTLRLLIPLHDMSASNGGTGIATGSHRDDEPAAQRQHPAVPAGGGLALHARVLHGGEPNRSTQERDVFVLQFGVAGAVLTHQANERLSLCGRPDFLRLGPGTA